MRGRIVVLQLILGLAATAAFAQDAAPPQRQPGATTIPADVYCSGMVTTEAVPRDTFIVSGEQSNYKTTFQDGNYVYINKGASNGVKVGDEFQVMRPVVNQSGVVWFSWQSSLSRAMGQQWEDEGRLRIVVAQPNVSIAQVIDSCNYLLRGDIVLPFVERPAPPLKPEDKFDRFAPPSGQKVAMLVTSKRYQMQLGSNDIAYVNLGSSQGVKVGDYFRIFRYQGNQRETPYQMSRFSFRVFGFGSVPLTYKWDSVPREVIGEGIVLRSTPNASTVLITFSLREAFLGDYVEIE
jgi:hypothetical protein